MARRPKKPEHDIQSELQFEEYAPQLRRMRPKLRPDTDIVPQKFHDKSFFVLQDPVTLQYYRVAETEREILAGLDGNTTLDEIYGRLKDKYGPRAPSFRELSHFVLSLRQANLTTPEGVEDTKWAVERSTKKRRQMVKQKLTNFMYFTIPIFDPEKFLNATMPFLRWLFSPGFFIIWIGTILTALVVAFYHAGNLFQPVNNILARENLVYLYIAFVLIKTCHELGHAYAAKKYGSEIHRMGIMMLVFMPCFYVDTTPVWALPEKWRRALVGAAGMIIELFIASLALYAWLVLDPSPIRTVLYNIVFIASVSTLLFNGNPLLRFDAYYILVDLIEIPNLRQRSTQYLQYLGKRYLIGEKVPLMTQTRREKTWFVCYGILATLYRFFIVFRIITFIASKLLIIGIAIALVVAVLWILVPFVKLLNYIFIAKNTRPVRARAVAIFLAASAAVVFLVGGVPLKTSVRAPCAIEPHEQIIIRAEWPGFIETIHVEDGQQVPKGHLLAQAKNDDLDYIISLQKLKIKEALVRFTYEQVRNPARAAAEKQLMDMLEKDLKILYNRKKTLSFYAPFDGRIIAPNMDRFRGDRFLQLGDELFTIASMDKLRITAIVSGTDIPSVSRPEARDVRIKFATYPDTVFTGKIIYPLPENKTYQPPPAALTNAAGGPVLLDPKSPKGKTLYPWFKVEITLDANADNPDVPAGATGTVRFIVGRKPIWEQAKLKLLRMINKRFLMSW